MTIKNKSGVGFVKFLLQQLEIIRNVLKEIFIPPSPFGVFPDFVHKLVTQVEHCALRSFRTRPWVIFDLLRHVLKMLLQRSCQGWKANRQLRWINGGFHLSSIIVSSSLLSAATRFLVPSRSLFSLCQGPFMQEKYLDS